MSLVELVRPFRVPFVERPTSPFIDEGEGAGYMREREREKTRRKKASGVMAPFISFMRVLPVL